MTRSLPAPRRGARIAPVAEGRREGFGGQLQAGDAPAALAEGGESAGPVSRQTPEGSVNKFRPVETGMACDLFGQPIDPRRSQRGRPSHLPTDATRALVRELRERGALQPEIARALGISGPTLRLNYPVELGSRSTVWKRRAAKLTDEEV